MKDLPAREKESRHETFPASDGWR